MAKRKKLIHRVQRQKEKIKYNKFRDSVKVFSQKQIWPFGSRQSTGYDIRQQIILCF